MNKLKVLAISSIIVLTSCAQLEKAKEATVSGISKFIINYCNNINEHTRTKSERELNENLNGVATITIECNLEDKTDTKSIKEIDVEHF